MQTQTSEFLYPIEPYLDSLIINHPRNRGNHIMSQFIWIVTSILGILFLFGGVGLIISGYFQVKLMHLILSEDYLFLAAYQEGQLEQFNQVLGLTVTVTGLLFLLIAILTKMIIKRNRYIKKVLIRREEIVKQFEAKMHGQEG